jgi:hypothetical protein
MKLPPYAYEEASTLSNELRGLVGAHYGIDNQIDDVVVAPYEENARNRFLMLYYMLHDAKEALALDYRGDKYDVLVLYSNIDGKDPIPQHMSACMCDVIESYSLYNELFTKKSNLHCISKKITRTS